MSKLLTICLLLAACANTPTQQDALDDWTVVLCTRASACGYYGGSYDDCMRDNLLPAEAPGASLTCEQEDAIPECYAAFEALECSDLRYPDACYVMLGY